MYVDGRCDVLSLLPIQNSHDGLFCSRDTQEGTLTHKMDFSVYTDGRDRPSATLWASIRVVD